MASSFAFDLDLIVRNGIVVTASDEVACDIGIKDGVVRILAEGLPSIPGCEEIDAEGAYVTVSDVTAARSVHGLIRVGSSSPEVSIRTSTSLSRARESILARAQPMIGLAGRAVR
jgi:hypothetical protein